MQSSAGHIPAFIVDSSKTSVSDVKPSVGKIVIHSTKKNFLKLKYNHFKSFCYKKITIWTNGGRGGIRTPDRLSPMPVFKTGAFNHSATHP